MTAAPETAALSLKTLTMCPTLPSKMGPMLALVLAIKPNQLCACNILHAIHQQAVCHGLIC